MSKKQIEEKDELTAINDALVTSEMYIEKNRKKILAVVLAVVVLVSGFFALRQFYWMPRAEKAMVELSKGEALFQAGDFQTALNGNGGDYMGFATIADEYSRTAAANLAYAYAGICYANLGDYAAAEKMLSEFDSDEVMVAPAIISLIGDCYVNQDKYQESISYYEDAIEASDNMATTPFMMKKLALAYNAMGQKEKAIEVLKSIKSKYPTSAVAATEVDKIMGSIEATK